MSDFDLDTGLDGDLHPDRDLDGDANDRVHHHARIGAEHPPGPDGSFTTLCGLRITPRPDAAKLPCCPMCALVMGRACS